MKGDRGEDLKWHFSNAGLLGAPRAWGLELGNTGESDTAGECQPLHSLGLSRAHRVPDFHLSGSGDVTHLSTGRGLQSH